MFAWKRLFDVLLAGIVLLILSPFFLMIALLIKLILGSPIFFAQERAGLYGKKFKILKFRTMRHAVDANGLVLPDAERVTRLGLFLRKTSLDELPELLNVLKGEMSIVGPRPFIAEYLPLYTSEQSKRHNVRPGITGLAQINGRNAITWEQKFAYDLEYVQTCSLLLDVKILFKTVYSVLRPTDINHGEMVTGAPRFMGTSEKD